jgi:hypothetical protein
MDASQRRHSCLRVVAKISRLVSLAALAWLASGSARADSFTIVPIFDNSITSDPAAATIEATINQAIGVYEALFNNPVTIHITFAEMTTGLGQSSFDLYQIPYSQFLSALGNETPSPQDTIALNNLPNTAANPVTSSTEMLIKPADAAVLGIDLGLSRNASDGTVSVNTALTTPGSSGTSGSYSLLSVTEHEIDEVLGLGSTLGLTLPGNENNMPSPEDLFRYDNSGNRSFTESPSALAYFSLNGTTLLTQFNNTGMGDYGDWSPAGPIQVQAAAATAGTSPVLGANEITALNVIGYTENTPEPSTWWLVPGAIAMIWWVRRARYTDRT